MHPSKSRYGQADQTRLAVQVLATSDHIHRRVPFQAFSVPRGLSANEHTKSIIAEVVLLLLSERDSLVNVPASPALFWRTHVELKEGSSHPKTSPIGHRPSLDLLDSTLVIQPIS